MGMMQGTVMALSEPSRLLSDNHQDARPVLKHFQTIIVLPNILFITVTACLVVKLNISNNHHHLCLVNHFGTWELKYFHLSDF